jgi:hypothetical protein
MGLLLAAMLGAAVPSTGQERSEPVLVTPRFRFYSDHEVNLHDALVAAGTARRAGAAERFGAAPETACFDGLPAAERAAWNRAVDYYAEVVAAGSGFDRRQMLPRLELLFRTADWARGDERTFIVLARMFRSAAAPAYERCRWPAQDARNRRWIETLRPLLAAHEETISRRLVELYGAEWQALPIPIDVVETVSWAGADSIATIPPPGHIWVSSAYPAYQQPAAALEIVFHEASHLLAGDGSPLRGALTSAGRAAERPLPLDLWHAVLFYTSGETVRRALLGTSEREHTPLIDALNIFGDVRGPIAAEWRPYLDGQRSLADAASGLVERLDATR